MFSSRFMLFPIFKKKIIKTILSHFTFYAIFNIKKTKKNEKFPFTYWLNGRWFLQIVDRDSGNLYIQYNPLFPCSNFGSQTYQMWGWFGGGGGVILSLHLCYFRHF